MVYAREPAEAVGDQIDGLIWRPWQIRLPLQAVEHQGSASGTNLRWHALQEDSDLDRFEHSRWWSLQAQE